MTIPEPASDRGFTPADHIIPATRFRPPALTSALPRPHLPWRPALIGFALLISLWATWFVLTASSVTFDVEPKHAKIDVLELFAPRVGNQWLLRSGKRAVRISAPGYQPFRGEIEITTASLQTQSIKLEPLPGHLRVVLSPDAPAELLIDGQPSGQVPGLVRDVAAGLRRIEIKAPRYQSFITELEIEGKGVEQTIDAKLEPAWAAISLGSKPPGATIKIDGKVLGPTPRDFELLQGRRALELELAGYKPWRQTLIVRAGKPVKLGTVVLAKADGKLAISSNPSAATVTLDGEFVGNTPLDLNVAPDKAHQLRLVKEGYVPLEQALTMASGKLEKLALELTPELATVQLETIPQDANLLVDGTPAGNATQTLSLATHAHELIIRREGFATYQMMVTPRRGIEKRFRIRLKTLDEVNAEQLASATPAPTSPAANAGGSQPGILTTSAGQQLKLFLGGRIVLGSSARDSARRANEAEREVVLERPFYLSVKEVSNGEFRRFLASHAVAPFDGKNLNDDTQPAAALSWQSAALYCNWLSREDGLPPFYQIKFGEVLGINPDATGYRLPTEAEWEWAARTPPKGAATIYAWGDRYPPSGRSGNYADTTAATLVKGAITSYTDGFAVAAPGGSFSPNLRDLYDMGGNVAEWVHDYYDAAPAQPPTRDPLGPSTGSEHVVKGASWAQGSTTELRLSARDFSVAARADVGFRLARYAQ